MIVLFSVQTIFYAAAVFIPVIMLLSLMLIFARKKLIPEGDLKIVVNGDNANPIIVQAGSNLLSALSDKNIFLPSACGGGGTCDV